MSYILIVVLFILVVRLNSRVNTVEGLLKGTGAIQPSAPPPPMYASPVPSQTAGQQPAPTPVVSVGPSAGDRFVAWFKEDWLLKLGALLLLIGFGWLTTYAFLNNWIGPFGRITLGITAGLLILVFGWYRMRSHMHQGGIFVIVGATTVLLTVFAGREAYDFFTPISALAVMFGTTVFVGLASVMYRVRWVALLGLILASLAPLLTAAPKTDQVGLFTYLLVVVIGTLWIVAVRGWRALTTAAVVIVALYSAPILFGVLSANRPVLLLLMYVFAALFFVFTTAGIVRAKTDDISADIVTVGGSGLLLLWWIMSVAEPQWQSLIIIAWMVVFLVGAFLVVKRTGDTRPFYVYSGVSVMMLGAATAAELSGAALTIAFAIEVTALYLVAHVLVDNRQKVENLLLLFAVPIFLSLPSFMSGAWDESVFNKDFFVLATLAAGLFLVFLVRRMSQGEKQPSQIDSVLIVLSSVYAYVLLWFSLHSLFAYAEDLATMTALITYTLIGLVCYFIGARGERRGLRAYGGALLAFVVGRLLVVDVWQMELTGRIATFFIIGILLMGTAFFGKKKEPVSLPSQTL